MTAQLIIGTYTERMPHVDGQADGILGCAYEDGTVGPPRLLAPARNPSWVTISPSGRNVYAVHETLDFEGQASGGITAYRRDPATGALTALGSRSSAGLAPAHVALHGDGRLVLAANYGSGSVAAYSVDDQGGLRALVGHAQHAGSSVDPDRQTGPHAHMIGIDPETGRVLVPDLGLDAVLSYQVSEGGELSEQTAERIVTWPGAGPRHLAFHPDGQHLFLLNEMDSTVLVLRRDGTRFIQTDLKSTLPGSCQDHSEAAAVRVSATGRYVLVSNRGFDSIAMLGLDAASGTLTLQHVEPTRGSEPRDFCLTPDGRYLLVANQDTHSIVSFTIDEEEPALRPVSAVDVPSPACLVFVP
jgi:6-phosphogluconolactonase